MDPKEFDIGFRYLSRDGKRVTQEDVQHFFKIHFPKYQGSLLKQFVHVEHFGKDDLARLVERSTVDYHYQVSHEPMATASLEHLSTLLSPHGRRKGCTKRVLQKFDLDQDGVIGLQDYIAMYESRLKSAEQKESGKKMA